ncbi:MAG: hypothetical protein WBZ36_06690 [Candidatus Nitrosopolaris sp.]
MAEGTDSDPGNNSVNPDQKDSQEHCKTEKNTKAMQRLDSVQTGIDPITK